jgi:hypothetical protein
MIMQNLCTLSADGLNDEIEMTEMELTAVMRRLFRLDLFASERITRILTRVRVQETIDLSKH